MTRKLLMALMILASGAGLAAPQEITISECGASARLHPGDTLVVRLPSQVTAGYLWHIASGAEGILRTAGEPVTEWPAGRPDQDGGSETRVFRFQAVAAGHGQLTFHESHPWAKEGEPLRSCTLSIEVTPAEF